MADFKATMRYRLQRDPHTGQLTGRFETKGVAITMTPENPTPRGLEALEAALSTAIDDLGRNNYPRVERQCRAAFAAYREQVAALERENALLTAFVRKVVSVAAVFSASRKLLESLYGYSNDSKIRTELHGLGLEAAALLSRGAGSEEESKSRPTP